MGDNICMFAYGQTGSGKTHTLTSVTEAAAQLMIDEMNFSKFDLRVSSLQIYLEKVQDLLNDAKDVGLAIGADKKLELKGQTWRYIDSIAAFNKAKTDSHENLKVSATKFNKQSSRSHHIF
jgi:kinesin family protein C1